MMETLNSSCTIGLFGTCDNVPWRDEFIKKYDDLGIDYFNPMVDNWSHELIANENHHLLNDPIVLFPVLKESLGFGSLGEIGFSIMTVLDQLKDRSLVVMIDNDCSPLRPSTDAEKRSSVNARKLVSSKLEKIQSPNLYVVNSLSEMLSLSIDLHKLHQIKIAINQKYKNCTY